MQGETVKFFFISKIVPLTR